MKYSAAFFFLILTVAASGQNLIPNGGFEEIVCPDNDYNSIDSTASWYAITNADAYWLHEDCPVEEALAEVVYFLNPEIEPFAGKGFMSLEGAYTTNGYFTSEGVGIQLRRPLRAGKRYYFTMAALQQPDVRAPDNPLNYCRLPSRFIEIHYADQPVHIRKETDVFQVYTGIYPNSDIALIDSTVLREDFVKNKWYVYWDCFIAERDGQYFGISGTNRRSTEMDACVMENTRGALFLYGYSIDELKLFELPEEIDTTLYICPDGGWVDLHKLLPDPYFLDKATYLWEDGCTEAVRAITTPGVYRVDMTLPCITVPITLTLATGTPCEAIFYTEEMPKMVEGEVDICSDKAPEEIHLSRFLPADMVGRATFQWDDGGREERRVLKEQGDYTVTVTADCYSFPLLLRVAEGKCRDYVYVPNAFSPNDDGNNDALIPFLHTPKDVLSYHFQVLDRWGSLVFDSRDPTASWTGMVDSRPLPVGAYLWVLEVELAGVDGPIMESGEVLLVR